MKRLLSTLLGLTLALPAPGTAKTVREEGPAGWCGTSISGLAIAHARHRLNERGLARKPQQTAARLAFGEATEKSVGPKVTKVENVAVIEDDGTIARPPNPFDMREFGVQFKRGGRWTRAERFGDGISSERGDRIDIGDDDSRAIDLPFPFTFYGVTYTRVFLNSDGNLTFNRSESASTPRSLTRFLEGPPRIAAYFADLDATAASGSGGVYLLVEQGRVRITWLDVPEFDSSDRNTIQLTLYPNGRVTVGYGDIGSPVGIIGVSPGGPGTINLVDFSAELPVDHKLDAIAEQYRTETEIDDLAAAAAVLSAVRDDYDHVVVFADFPASLGDAFAYELNVKNDTKGIGLGVFDVSSLFGSGGRLESFVQMGSLAKYPAEPDLSINPGGDATGIGILAHEVGHRWLAFVTFRDAQGNRSQDLLGRQQSHWSFLLDSDGSVMEGNDIRDDGNGTFRTVGAWMGYSPLDEYLMGLRQPGEVPPFFYVSGSILDAEAGPRTNVVIQGQRRDVTVNQVIAAEGPRVPAVGAARKSFNVAVALLARQGEAPRVESIKKANRYGNRLMSFFQQETEGRGRVFTSLRLRPEGTATPAAAPAAAPAAPAVAPPAAPAAQPAQAAPSTPAVERPPVEAPAVDQPEHAEPRLERFERFLDFPFFRR